MLPSANDITLPFVIEVKDADGRRTLVSAFLIAN